MGPMSRNPQHAGKAYTQITFRRIESLGPGDILSLLKRSYARWPRRNEHLDAWARADRAFFEHPDTVGACCIVTFQAARPVGFVSWDPRERPTARIGHNCVLPDFQGKGIGKAQLQNALGLLRRQGFSRVHVRTGGEAFFAPARSMYRSCGFIEAGWAGPNSSTPCGTVDYHLELRPEGVGHG